MPGAAFLLAVFVPEEVLGEPKIEVMERMGTSDALVGLASTTLGLGEKIESVGREGVLVDDETLAGIFFLVVLGDGFVVFDGDDRRPPKNDGAGAGEGAGATVFFFIFVGDAFALLVEERKFNGEVGAGADFLVASLDLSWPTVFEILLTLVAAAVPAKVAISPRISPHDLGSRLFITLVYSSGDKSAYWSSVTSCGTTLVALVPSSSTATGGCSLNSFFVRTL